MAEGGESPLEYVTDVGQPSSVIDMRRVQLDRPMGSQTYSQLVFGALDMTQQSVLSGDYYQPHQGNPPPGDFPLLTRASDETLAQYLEPVGSDNRLFDIRHIEEALRKKGLSHIADRLLKNLSYCRNNSLEDQHRVLGYRAKRLIDIAYDAKVLEPGFEHLFRDVNKTIFGKLSGFYPVSDDNFWSCAQQLHDSIKLLFQPPNFAVSRICDGGEAALEACRFRSKIVSSNQTVAQWGRTLGHGSFSTACHVRTHHRGTATDLVVKEYKQPISFDPNEMKMTCCLPLDLCVPFTFGCMGNRVFSMSNFRGRTLDKVIKREFPLTTPVSCAFVAQMLYDLCLDLRKIHSNDRIHKDIKPENVVATKDGRQGTYRFSFIDYGGCISTTAPPSFKDFVKSASPAYMAPEVAKIYQAGKKAFDRAHIASPEAQGGDMSPSSRTTEVRPSPAYDLWCLGLLVYYCQERWHPFVTRDGDDTKPKVLAKIIEHPETPLRIIEEGVESGINDFKDLFYLLCQLLHEDRALRQSAAYYIDELSTFPINKRS